MSKPCCGMNASMLGVVLAGSESPKKNTPNQMGRAQISTTRAPIWRTSADDEQGLSCYTAGSPKSLDTSTKEDAVGEASEDALSSSWTIDVTLI